MLSPPIEFPTNAIQIDVVVYATKDLSLIEKKRSGTYDMEIYTEGGFKNNPKTESDMKQCFMPGHLPMPQMYLVVSCMKDKYGFHPAFELYEKKTSIQAIELGKLSNVYFASDLCISNQATLIRHPTWGRRCVIEVSGIYNAIFMATKVSNGSPPIHIHFIPLIIYFDPHYQHLQQVSESR